jgi:hypothetical protein
MYSGTCPRKDHLGALCVDMAIILKNMLKEPYGEWMFNETSIYLYWMFSESIG